MNKHLFVSCLAAAVLVAGATAAPSWAKDTDSIRAGQFVLSESMDIRDESRLDGITDQTGAWDVRPIKVGAGVSVAQQEEEGQEEGAAPSPEAPQPESD